MSAAYSSGPQCFYGNYDRMNDRMTFVQPLRLSRYCIFYDNTDCTVALLSSYDFK